ncbi:MAG: hypothetical protein IPF51_10580 [Dehalococcoidia bacterium]|uniref:hypothetical protein n=1 Tax=Candidatus Amarobacter glycogenicus TaxID=3140699 RepID=UPI0031347F8A|nr:hypothetical protein [Dehalococcoidia bacterium]
MAPPETSWFHALPAGNTWHPPIIGAVTEPVGVVGVAVGGIAVGVAVAGRGVLVGIGVAGLGVVVPAAVGAVVVGVFVGFEIVPHFATTSEFETRDVVRRAPLHFRRTWSPGCSVVEEVAANAATTPRARMSAAPMAPGRVAGACAMLWSGFPGAGSHWHIRPSRGDVRARFGNPCVKSSVPRREQGGWRREKR